MPDGDAEPGQAPMEIWRPTAADTENARAALSDLRNRLNRDLDGARCDVFLYAKHGRTLDDRYRRLVMRAELASDFKTEFDTAARRLLVTAIDEPEGLRPNAFGEHIEGTIGYLPLASMGPFGENIANVPPDGTWEHGFNPDEQAFVDHLKTLYVSIAFGQTNPERLLVAQAYSVARVVTKGIRALFINNEYARLEASSVMTISPDIHFLLWRGNIYLTRLDKFETQTDFREATKAIAGQVWDGLVATLPFHDADQLRTNLLAKPIYSKKLSKLGQAEYLAQLQLDLIRDQIAVHGLAMRIEERDGQQFLVLNNPNDPKALMDLLRLLDDDLWRSVLTGIRYAARAKDRR